MKTKLLNPLTLSLALFSLSTHAGTPCVRGSGAIPVRILHERDCTRHGWRFAPGRSPPCAPLCGLGATRGKQAEAGFECGGECGRVAVSLRRCVPILTSLLSSSPSLSPSHEFFYIPSLSHRRRHVRSFEEQHPPPPFFLVPLSWHFLYGPVVYTHAQTHTQHTQGDIDTGTPHTYRRTHTHTHNIHSEHGRGVRRHPRALIPRRGAVRVKDRDRVCRSPSAIVQGRECTRGVGR